MPLDLGTKIRVKRAAANISQRALARLLGPKCHWVTLNRWERGICAPRTDYMNRLRQFFKMDAAAVKLVATRAGLRPRPKPKAKLRR
jgi:transcriptional regulator with XRE-family HTH domain